MTAGGTLLRFADRAMERAHHTVSRRSTSVLGPLGSGHRAKQSASLEESFLGAARMVEETMKNFAKLGRRLGARGTG